MVAVSTLISDVGVIGQRFFDSLGVVNNYANKDRTMQVKRSHTQLVL